MRSTDNENFEASARTFVASRRIALSSTLPASELINADDFSEQSSQAAFLNDCRYFLRTYVLTSRFVQVFSSDDTEIVKEAAPLLSQAVDDWVEKLNAHEAARNVRIRNQLASLISEVSENPNSHELKLERIWKEEPEKFVSALTEIVNEALSNEVLKETDILEGISADKLAPEESLETGWKAPFFAGNKKIVKTCLNTLAEFSEWSFWHSLFDDLSHGKHLNIGLASSIANIDDQIWEIGPAAVSAEIERISADFFIEEADLVEELYFDAAAERIARKTPPSANGKALELTIASIADDLEEALRGNFLSDETYVVRVLKKTITIHADNPERVEMDLVKVGKNLRRQIDAGDLPDAPEIEGLHDTCVTGALDIRAHHPDIAEARKKRSLQAIREASSEERALLKESYTTIREISEDNLATDLIEDLEEIVDGRSVSPSGDISETTDAIVRSGSRLAKMWLIAKNVGSWATSAAKSVGTFAKAAQDLKKLWPLLMNLLGL